MRYGGAFTATPPLARAVLALAFAAATVIAVAQDDGGHEPAAHGGSHGAGHEASATWDRESALAYSQAALGREVRDVTFTATDGRRVSIADYRGRPLVVSLVYTSCYHVCPVLTRNLARAVEVAREALGAGTFAVVTVGFDTANDTPPRLASFAREQGVDTAGWAFLSGDRAAVEALAEDLGFIYFPTARGFDHLAQTSIVDAGGRVYRQVYGAELDPPALVEPLKDLLLGRSGQSRGLSGWWEGLKLFCTLYDPASGRYRFNYSVIAMLAAAVLSLGATIGFVLYALLNGRRPRAGA